MRVLVYSATSIGVEALADVLGRYPHFRTHIVTTVDDFEFALAYAYEAVIIDVAYVDGPVNALIRAVRAYQTHPCFVMGLFRESVVDQIATYLRVDMDGAFRYPYDLPHLAQALCAGIMRRHSLVPGVVCVGKFSFDLLNCVLSYAGEVMKLTPLHTKVIAYLMLHRGQKRNKEQIMSYLYFQDYGDKRTDDSIISSVVSLLRKQLREQCGESLIDIRAGYTIHKWVQE